MASLYTAVVWRGILLLIGVGGGDSPSVRHHGISTPPQGATEAIYILLTTNHKCNSFIVKSIFCKVVVSYSWTHYLFMMTSSNGNIFRVIGPLCGEFTGPGEFPTQRPATRSFDVFFDLRLNKRLSKQPWDWWFEAPSWSLWCHCIVWTISAWPKYHDNFMTILTVLYKDPNWVSDVSHVCGWKRYSVSSGTVYVRN